MKIILTNNDIKNDEDYRSVLKIRMAFALILFILGLFALVTAFNADSMFGVTLNDHQHSFMSGIGTGFIAGSIIILIKFLIIYRNDDKVRKSRIASTDERIQSISGKALTISGLILFAAIYFIGVIGGMIYPILINVMLILVAIFLLSYFIIYRVLASRM